MKKRKLNGLTLNKQSISKLNSEQVIGGFTAGNCTTGCTDGCTPLRTEWNCTKQNCSGDCPVSDECPDPIELELSIIEGQVCRF